MYIYLTNKLSGTMSLHLTFLIVVLYYVCVVSKLNEIKVILGPTAAGKSKFAMEWCSQFGGEIVCADSMQVYTGMDIGTAKPTKQEQEQIAHHCLDLVDPSQNFSVGQWVQCADKAISQICNKGKIPIICGGTGLYVKSLLFKHSFVQADESLRVELQNELDKHGNQHMHNLLSNVDGVSASKINANDTKRVLRALEIYRTTGKPKSQVDTIDKEPRYKADIHVVNMDRDKLYSRIDERVDIMIEQGLVDEVSSLLAYKDCQSMQAIGYKEIVSFLKGDISKHDAIELIKKNTRNYAKRQLTYLRHQFDVVLG